MKKIVFVDDEINLLEGLKRSLRIKKKEWDMSFFTKPEEALEFIKKTGADIIVSDYKMPVMNGIELIGKIRETTPEIFRILLSGQSDSSVFDKLVDLVDIYIPKPCDIKQLIDAIENKKK